MYVFVNVTDELGRVTLALVYIPANDNSVDALSDPMFMEAA